MNRKYGVFISHREEDREIARVLQYTLGILSKFKLDRKKNIYLCEDIPGGTKWRNWIEKKIAESNILIFLYTEENADWRWCLYEIGLFIGSHGKDKAAHMITLKNPNVEKLLPPVDQYQHYNADGPGITDFLKDLCFDGKFTQNEVFNDEFNTTMPEFKENFAKIVNAFLLPRQETEYCTKRIWFDFSTRDEKQDLRESIENAVLGGDDAALQILAAQQGASFKALYEQFSSQDQNKWLDEIRDAWNEIKQNRRVQGLLTRFVTRDQMYYRPVISQIDKHRLMIENSESVIPKRLVAILVPCVEGPAESLDAPGAFESALFFKNWSTYLPFSIVHIRWRKKSGMVYAKEDLIGEPIVCAMNQAFSELFDFAAPSSLDTDGPNAWTSQRLFDQIRDYVLPEHMTQLERDQTEVSRRIIFEERPGHAKVPLQFNEQHPNTIYRNGIYLPCLIAKRIVGKQTSEHETYLLIVYVKDFYPID